MVQITILINTAEDITTCQVWIDKEGLREKATKSPGYICVPGIRSYFDERKASVVDLKYRQPHRSKILLKIPEKFSLGIFLPIRSATQTRSDVFKISFTMGASHSTPSASSRGDLGRRRTTSTTSTSSSKSYKSSSVSSRHSGGSFKDAEPKAPIRVGYPYYEEVMLEAEQRERKKRDKEICKGKRSKRKSLV